MSSSTEGARVLIKEDASRAAYRIAQAVHKLVIDRAVALAAEGEETAPGKKLVTVELVRRAMKECSIEEACNQVGVDWYGKPKSRMVA
jgi:hypothetical protein